MITKRKTFIIFVGLLLAAQVFFVSTVAAEDGTVDSETVERLDRLIKEQQQQLESLQQQVNELKKTATQAQTEAKEAKSVAEEAKTTVQAPLEKVVTSGHERVKLAISGQVHRAVNVSEDGKNTKAYFVDSDASNTRVRFVGTAKASDDLTAGTRIEVAIAPNESSEVSQDNEESGDFFDQRWAEVSLDSKRFGKLSLGKGDTASNNSAEVDLSKTDIVQYSSIADVAGGLLFRQTNGDTLTGVSVSDAFSNLDGLSRRSRVRYDTPTFYGFHLATSLVSDQRYDASLWWGGQGYGFKAAGAAAFAYPNQDDTDFQYDGSFSLLHEDTGLNLTLSAGLRERDNQGDQENFYAKVGWLTTFFSLGETGFGVDYTRSLNLPTGRDEGYSVGAAAVQHFEDYGTEIYLQYRHHSLERDVAPSVQDINVGTIGARVKF
ncbi:MAG: porin [Deltaproteobacteria bacterium]|nr:porin [Deltaproteobacteria bacterium]MDH3964868.1 porin [Deltaproteobacteria bacterium]